MLNFSPRRFDRVRRPRSVDAPQEECEKEADLLAAQVTGATAPNVQAPNRYSEASPPRAETAHTTIGGILGSPGQPIDAPTRAFMERGFGHSFAEVRVHTGVSAAEAASALDARAFTVGADVVFGAGEYQPQAQAGRTLLAHELTHVLQQRGSGSGAPASGLRVARQPKSSAAPRKPIDSRVVSSRTEDRARTLVQVHIIGHASPRWRSAVTDREADQRNAELSEDRAQATRAEVETLVREALPGHDLAFRYDYTPADAHNEPSGVILGSESKGSVETLGEAGARQRKANDSEMRRVEVTVDLSSFIDSTRVEEVEETHQESTATRDWALKVAFTAQVQVGAGVGYIMLKIKNGKTGEEATAHGGFSKGGAGVSAKLDKFDKATAIGGTVDWGDYTNFATGKPVTFSDFDYINFCLRTHGVSIGAIGYEVAKLTLFDLPGGTVWGIDVGGWNSGKLGIDLASLAYGMIKVENAPRGTRHVKSMRTQVDRFESSAVEEHRHRVLFQTGQSTIRPDEQKKLRAYVVSAVRNYDDGGH